VYQPSVIENECVAFAEVVREYVFLILEEIRKPLESRIEFLWSRQWKGTLLGRGVIDMRNFSMRREWCRRSKFDREVILVYVMTVVNIMERHWCFGQNIEVGGVGFPQTLSSEDAIDGYRGATNGFIP